MKGKAMTVSKYADHKQRVTAPLARMPDGSYARISWERAISEIATKLNGIIDCNSPRSVALIGGGGQANHLDYLYASGFLRLIGSPWHFNALAQEFTQKYWVHGHMFGSEGLDFGASLASSEVCLVIGSNPWMSAGFQRTRELVKEISKDPSRTLIVVDPRRHETARRADTHLQIRPGTDLYFLVSARGGNYEGTTGFQSDDTERTGYATTDICDDIGYGSHDTDLGRCTGDVGPTGASCPYADLGYPDQHGNYWTLEDLRGRTLVLWITAFG